MIGYSGPLVNYRSKKNFQFTLRGTVNYEGQPPKKHFCAFFLLFLCLVETLVIKEEKEKKGNGIRKKEIKKTSEPPSLKKI